MRSYLSDTFRAHTSEGVCRLVSAGELPPPRNGWRAFYLRFGCAGQMPVRLSADFLLDRIPDHLHFVRLEQDGHPAGERVLTFEERTWEIARQSDQSATNAAGAEAFSGGASTSTAAGRGDVSNPFAAGTAGIARYVSLGVEHILSGYDHLAFVVALLLLAGSLREVVLVASAFTVSHSITLGLAALGLARPDTGFVEAMIGFSIALVAVENAWLLSGKPRAVPFALALSILVLGAATSRAPSFVALTGLALFSLGHFSLLARATRPQLVRAAVAFLFGLVHGFGFAGILTPALPGGRRLVTALLGFNAGVEVGQLLFIAVLWPLLLMASRHGARRAVAEAGSAAIAGLGAFWFVLRALGA